MCSLFELHKGDKFKLVPETLAGEPIKVPPAHEDPSFDLEYLFDHIDGMYSYCLNMQNQVIHLQAWAEVAPLVKKAKPD
jgi:hypothetical protein